MLSELMSFGSSSNMDLSEITGKIEKFKTMLPLFKDMAKSYLTEEERKGNCEIVAMAQLSEKDGEVKPLVTLMIIEKKGSEIVLKRVAKDKEEKPMQWDVFALISSVNG